MALTELAPINNAIPVIAAVRPRGPTPINAPAAGQVRKVYAAALKSLRRAAFR